MSKSRKRSIEQIKADLAYNRTRLNELRILGDEACSKYDLSMGYDAKFSIGLVEGHIIYDERELVAAEGNQQTLL